MRTHSALLALAVLPWSGCTAISAPVDTDGTIFEIEYVNFAWVPTWRGFAIDSTGAIRTYDLEGQAWRPADEDYPTRAELAAKHATNATTSGSVGEAELRGMQERAVYAAGGPLSNARNRCADAGTFTYSAWLYDPGRDAFRRVLLWREGDVAQLNESPAGRQLSDWLKSLRLVPRVDGCQP